MTGWLAGMRMAVLGTALLLGLLPASGMARELVLQLKWYHQYQFAGYYVALEKGYYRDAGLTVELRPGAPGLPSPIQAVVAGQADFGVDNAGLVLARLAGEPVVALAAIFQHSPMVWLVRADSDIVNLHDLIGKRLMLIAPFDRSGNAELLQPFLAEGLDLAGLTLQPTSYDIQSLVREETDAFNSYLTNEPYELRQLGVPYRVISPRNYGVDFYSDILFTSEALLQQQPELVAAFRQASLKGWRYAMDHVEEVAALIKQRYAPSKSLDQLLFEANAMRQLIEPELMEIGHMNPGRWQFIAQTLSPSREPGSQPDLAGFLYTPELTMPDLTHFYLTLGVAALALLLMGTLLSWFYRINRKLRLEVRRRLNAERELRHLSQIDVLTGLNNRRHWQQLMAVEFSRYRRYGEGFSLAMIDVDWFKQVNDQFGHQVGDQVLVQLAQRLRSHVRRIDQLARIGGEEFVLLLPDTSLEDACQDARRLCQLVAEEPFPLSDGRRLPITVSIGVAAVQVQDPGYEACVQRADRALYRAKAEGRNRIETEPPGSECSVVPPDQSRWPPRDCRASTLCSRLTPQSGK